MFSSKDLAQPYTVAYEMECGEDYTFTNKNNIELILKSVFLLLYHLKFHCYCTPIYIYIYKLIHSFN